MGLVDDYHRKYWLFGPSIPNQGHERHMMGEFWGNVAQHEIDSIVENDGVETCGCN